MISVDEAVIIVGWDIQVGTDAAFKFNEVFEPSPIWLTGDTLTVYS